MTTTTSPQLAATRRSGGRTGSLPRAQIDKRVVPVDHLKSLLIAWIIAGHAILGYTAIGGWPYDEVNEVSMSPRAEYALSAVLGPTALFVIGTFFFIAGLFAPQEMDHRGPGQFAARRAVRLGLPWLVFTLAIWPLFMWFAYRAAGHDVPIWYAWQLRQPFLDSGPLWFVQVLLYVSLAYALWRWRWGRRTVGTIIGAGHLAVLAAAIAASSFLVRLWYPARSQQILDLHLWQWPECLGMFLLGILVSGQGWTRQVPRAVARRCGIGVVVTLLLAPIVLLSAGVNDFSAQGVTFLGGWHWRAFALAAFEASLVVGGSVWLLSWAQRHLTSRSPVLLAAGRASYAAFMLQAPVLITLEIAARNLPLPATIKAVVVGAAAVALSFWLGWLIVKRTRLGHLL